MSARPRPLAGRVVLVVGAGDRVARDAAIRLSALGAAIVAADARLHEAAVTAGLVAASRGTARVIEEPAPPLPWPDLVRAATAALAAPTDALLSEGAFPSPADAAVALAALAAALPAGTRTVLVPASPEGGSKGFATRLADRFLAGPG